MKTSVKWVYFGAAAMVCTSLWIRPRTERSGVTAAVEPVITGAGTNRLARRVGDRLILEADMNYVARANEALSLTDPLQRPMQFCPLFREWVEADPESALAYLRQMPRGNEYGEGVGLMLGRVQLSDPERAVSLAPELVTRHEEMHLYNQLFSA